MKLMMYMEYMVLHSKYSIYCVHYFKIIKTNKFDDQNDENVDLENIVNPFVVNNVYEAKEYKLNRFIIICKLT
jgi:hypothetical protein